MEQGINSENVKINNRALVLKTLLSNDAIARSEIAQKLGLTRATVTSICNDFIKQGLLVELDELDEGRHAGRKKRPVALQKNCRFVLAISIHSSITTVNICDLKGNPKDGTSLQSNSAIPPEDFLQQIAACCTKLLWQNHLTAEWILGVGVAILGPVDQNNGISLNAFGLWNRAVPIAQILSQELRLPVCVESNVCSMLEAELLYEELKAKNILAVKWGPGVGSASAINGSVYKGRQFRSSELGHNVVSESRKRCRCGKTGCLETLLSIDAVSEYAQALVKQNPEGTLAALQAEFGPLKRDNIDSFLAVDDSAFQKYLFCLCQKLATVINNAIQIIAPDCVVLYGCFFESQPVIDQFMRLLFSINPELSPEMFRFLPWDDLRESIGATAVVVKRLLVDAGGLREPAVTAGVGRA